VRVRFNGSRPTGNTLQGSRCSDFYDWHCRHTILKDRIDPTDPTKVIAKRDTGDGAETDTNDIGPGAIQVPLP